MTIIASHTSVLSTWKVSPTRSNLSADARDKSRKFKTARDVPGPFALPILGTRWIYFRCGHYCMNKIHEAYKGKDFGLIASLSIAMILIVRHC